nr:uncharacterized protein LOC109167964 isoform X1 [Ipomoea batatas]
MTSTASEPPSPARSPVAEQSNNGGGGWPAGRTKNSGLVVSRHGNGKAEHRIPLPAAGDKQSSNSEAEHAVLANGPSPSVSLVRPSKLRQWRRVVAVTTFPRSRLVQQAAQQQRTVSRFAKSDIQASVDEPLKENSVIVAEQIRDVLSVSNIQRFLHSITPAQHHPKVH